MKRISFYLSAFLLAAMTLGVETSCSSSDELSSATSSSVQKQLTLTIKTKELTKAAAAADPGTDKENTINRITIGIFDQAGNTVRTIQEFSPTATESEATAGSNKFYNATNGSATVSVVTTELTSTDQLLVAINAPANHFANVMTATAFKAKSLTAAQALYTKSDASAATDELAVSDNIPMFGTATITGSGTTFSATVNPIHLAAKVTLESLKVEYAANGPYSKATFTPTEIFVDNVADGLLFNDAAPYSSTSTFLTGESTATSPVKYLSTGVLETENSKTLKGESDEFGKKFFFYVTPNKNVEDNKTRLVIKGQFSADGTAGSAKTVYFPVKLNSNVSLDGSHAAAESGTTEYQVYPNKNYKCSITLKSVGSTEPDKEIDPTVATINVTVTPFSDVTQSTIFQ